MVKTKKSLYYQGKDVVSSDFLLKEKNTIHEISSQLVNTMNINSLKKVSPRDLCGDSFKDLLTPEQKIFLMNRGLIYCESATKEEKRSVRYSDRIEKSVEYSTPVPQGGYKIEQDIPLTSDGFSQCHAVILYDHATCSTMMLHVVDWSFELEHIDAIKDFLSDKKNGEAIFVYGSESRCSPDRDHKFLQ